MCLIIQLLDNIGIVAFNIIYKTEISILLCCINGFLYKILIILSKEIEEKYLINSLNFLSLIAIASLFTSCEKSFISEFNDVYNILKETKGYRFFISKEVRLIISLCIVINKYTEEMKADLIDININDEISILLVLEEQTAISIASI